MGDIKFSDALRQHYMPGLNSISRTSNLGMREWLRQSDNFVPDNIPSKKDGFAIELYDLNEALPCWAKDINRLSCASFETLDGIREIEDDKKFLAWQLVQYYYSAFYSAHAILKMCGYGLIQLDNITLSNIKQRAITLGVTLPQLNKGVYCMTLTGSNRLNFYKLSKYDDSHKGLWKRYYDFMGVIIGTQISTGNFDASCLRVRISTDSTSESVYSQMSAQDAAIVVQRIDDLRRSLNQHNDCNWLSSIRNSINYNHMFGIWFPNQGFQNNFSTFVSMRKEFCRNPLDDFFNLSKENDELTKFVKCCQLINAINMSLILDMAGRHPNNKSFLLYGPVAFLKLHKI